MSFRIALSGLNAASTHLDVTAHNIANVNTAGFKSSRAMFSDVFATASNDLSATASGSGVQVAAIDPLVAMQAVGAGAAGGAAPSSGWLPTSGLGSGALGDRPPRQPVDAEMQRPRQPQPLESGALGDPRVRPMQPI